MSHAPAGWYKHPDAPGVALYWDGSSWWEPGTSPHTEAPVASGSVGERELFTPAPDAAPQSGFAPAQMPAEVGTEALGAPEAEAPLVVAPVSASPLPEHTADQPEPNYDPAAEEEPMWDVVGVPRAVPASAQESEDARWQAGLAPATQPPSRATGGYAPQWSPEPYAAAYETPSSARRRISGAGKVAIAAAIVVLGIGVRWGLATMFGGDYSDDGPIQVAVPIEWETHIANSPNLTYAMDTNWIPVLRSNNVQQASAGTRLIDARVITTGISGNGGILILASSLEPFPAGKVSREDWTAAFDEALEGMEATGDATVTDSKKSVLTSKAGDKWGFLDATIISSGSEVHFYAAAAGIDGYLVVMELIVPPGAELTQNDILAVANSIEER